MCYAQSVGEQAHRLSAISNKWTLRPPWRPSMAEHQGGDLYGPEQEVARGFYPHCTDLNSVVWSHYKGSWEI